MAVQQPLQALLISPGKRERNRILKGSIRATIRPGKRLYRDGFVMLCCHIVPWCVRAQITSVTHIPFAHITTKTLRDAGYQNYRLALDGIRRHYPAFTGEKMVTVITWDTVEGRLRDELPS